MSEGPDQRLHGWKAIGSFLGRDARTARRWEQERGLPVNRIPGGGSSSVWADADELKSWMAKSEPEPDAAAPPTLYKWLLGFGLAAIAGIAIFLLASGNRAHDKTPAPYGNDAESNALYRTAMLAVERRNAPGLNRAAADFTALTEAYPKIPEGFVGLAEANLLLREFNALPDSTAYRRASLAAAQALALDAKNYRAKRALGFIRYWSDGKKAEGLKLLSEAITLKPDDQQSHHWYGTALMGEGRYKEALAQIDTAARLSPGSSAIEADRAYALYLVGQPVAAKKLLKKLVQIDRGFSGSHSYLERIALLEGDDAAYLEYAETTAELRGQRDRLDAILAAKKAFQTGGRKAMLSSLIAAEERKFEQDEESAIRLASLEGANGSIDRVRYWLAKAIETKESGSEALPAYIEFRRFVGQPGFDALLSRR